MFDNRVVVVTGAASGIGRSAALAFAREGGKVVAVDRDGVKNAETAQIIRCKGGEAVDLQIDVSDPVAVKLMVTEVADRFGRLDVACNNAGIEGTMALTADYTVEEWDRVMGVNLRVSHLHPIGRMGTADEVAEAILWLASTKSSFVSGTSLLVDGAYVAQ